MRWERRDERTMVSVPKRIGRAIGSTMEKCKCNRPSRKPTAIWQAGWATGERVRRAGGLGMVGRCWAGGVGTTGDASATAHPASRLQSGRRDVGVWVLGWWDVTTGCASAKHTRQCNGRLTGRMGNGGVLGRRWGVTTGNASANATFFSPSPTGSTVMALAASGPGCDV